MKTTTKRFVYFGRLAHEKGVDLIVETFSRIANAGINGRSLDIYGAGPYDTLCTGFARTFPTSVTFHGRTPQDIIRKVLPTYNFCLMPSRVIETFGKSALESLAAGVQVIGYRHGGLEQFIDPILAIGPGEDDFFSLITALITSDVSIPIHQNLSPYYEEARISNIVKLTEGKKRIMMVSDCIASSGGGIETFIDEATSVLKRHGYDVTLCGSSKPVGFWGLFATALNIKERLRLQKKIHVHNPDIIRYHSTLRRIGWLPMMAVSKKREKRRMFHDMGYVHPFPARLSSCNNIPVHQTLIERLHAGQRGGVRIILIFLKRILHKTISLALTSYKHILVPSNFLVPIAQKRLKRNDILHLPHFISPGTLPENQKQ